VSAASYFGHGVIDMYSLEAGNDVKRLLTCPTSELRATFCMESESASFEALR